MSQQLKRSLSYPLLTLYGLGTILGAGIYVLIGKVAATSGLYAPLSFLLAAVLAGFSGYCYAALSSRYPQSAGEAAYVHAAFNIKALSTLVGWMVIATGIVSAATIANGFVGYLQLFVALPEFWAISLLLLCLCLLACWGVLESVAVAAVITLIELGGLLLVISVAGGELSQLPERLPELLPKLLPSINEGEVWWGILLGAFLAFYAFIGFEDMVNMAEEVKEPQRTLPKAIISALIISALLYVLIAVIAVLALPLETLQNSEAPMTSILSRYSEQAGFIISLISLVAVVNGALVQIIMGSRVLYGMARQHLAPQWLGRVHPRLQTPVIATLIISLSVWLLAVALPLTTLAKITSFIIILVFLLVNFSLIRILKKEIETPTPTQAMNISPIIPWLSALLCTIFLCAQIATIF